MFQVVVAAVKRFPTTTSRRIFFAGQKGIIIIVFETRVLYLQMQKDISGMRKRRILLPANKPRRDNPEQNIQQLTCLAFQASRYLSPSPKGRKK